ncbi:MAG TPA: thioredoxin fold domain-containing protein [Burkholderiales bacterium]
MRVLLALAIALAALTARAQPAEVPGWFAESFLEFPQDVREAARDGKRLMLYFWQEGCPYCKLFVETTLADRTIQERTRRHFVAVALDIFGAREVEWVDGRRMSEKALAQALNVKATPTLLFLDERGGIALRVVGYVPPERFAASLEDAKRR